MTRLPTADFAKRCDQVFGTPGTFERLQEDITKAAYPPWFSPFVHFESKAVRVHCWDNRCLTGLLQTEDYARAIVSSVRPILSEDAIERAVALRMTRQQILEPDDGVPLDQNNGPRLWAIIDESALNRVVGSPQIMRTQREHLATMAYRPNVTIQIIPNSEGATCAFGRAFAVLVSRNNSSVVYFEDIGTARYVRDRDEVSRYNLIFDYLRSCALNDKQSIELIKGGAK